MLALRIGRTARADLGQHQRFRSAASFGPTRFGPNRRRLSELTFRRLCRFSGQQPRWFVRIKWFPSNPLGSRSAFAVGFGLPPVSWFGAVLREPVLVPSSDNDISAVIAAVCHVSPCWLMLCDLRRRACLLIFVVEAMLGAGEHALPAGVVGIAALAAYRATRASCRTWLVRRAAEAVTLAEAAAAVVLAACAWR